MRKVATTIKATLVVMALGLLSIQAQRNGYFDNLSIKSWFSSTKKNPTATKPKLTPKTQQTPTKLVNTFLPTPKLKTDFFMGGLAKPLIKNGKACDCVEITTEGRDQRGRVFSYEKLNLRKDFALELDFYFGTRTDNGADGQILMIHNDPRGNDAQGDFGEGLGYGTGRNSKGVAPSIGIEMDTWQNPARMDPSEDHIAYLENGVVTHNDPTFPLIKMPEMEDGKEHRLRFEWYASAKKVKVYWDKNNDKEIDKTSELLFEVNRDLIDLLGTATPYWGISGATGHSYNLQYFCNPHGKLIFTPTDFCATYEGLQDKSSVEGLGKVHPLLNVSTGRGKAQVLYQDGRKTIYTAPNGKDKVVNGCLGNGKGFADTESSKKRLHDYTFTFENNAAVKNFSMQMLDFGDYNAAKAQVQSAILVGYNAKGEVVDTDSLIVTATSHGNLKLTGDACTAKPGEPGNYTFKLVGDGMTKVKVLYYNDGKGTYAGNRPSDPNIAIGNVCFTMDANASPNPPANMPDCKAYAVNTDQGNSQFYTVDINNHNFVLPLGDANAGADIQGVELHPVHGVLYAVSGSANANNQKGHLFKVNTSTGELTSIGATGYTNLTSLAFNRMDNHLWAWATGTGLVQIDLATGQATVKAASNYQVSGLSWDKDGDKLYATVGAKLFAYDNNTQKITEVAHNLPGETSALEVRPDGLLMGAVSKSGAMTVFVYDLGTLQTVKKERLTTSYNKITAFAWADWCDINDDIVIPAQNCVAFDNITPGTVVEGMGTAHPLLDITTGGGLAKRLSEGGTDIVYITEGKLANGCIGAGFADTRPSATRTHDYAFKFKPGTTVNSFSLRLVDYGDWNPAKATEHSAKLVAYDKDGNVINTDELKHTTQAGKTIGKKGDACGGQEGESGRYTFTVTGNGIAQVKLEFSNNGTTQYGGNRPSDPNIAINKVCFFVETDVEPPLIPCEASVYYANHTNGVNSKIYTTQTDLTNKTVTFKEIAELPFSDAHIALSLDGKRLYAVKGSGNNELGYLKLDDNTYHTIGYLNVGKITQLSFSPNGKLYFTDNSSNEVYVMNNIEATLYTNLGKINLNNGFLNIQGGDITFAQDGTFYVSTAANGGRVYRVVTQAGVMTAEEIGSTPRSQINGIAVLNHGTGSLVYAGKGKKGFSVVDPSTGATYDLAAKGDLSVLGYGDMSSSCMDELPTGPDPGPGDGEPLTCGKIRIEKIGNNVKINNDHDKQIVVYYTITDAGNDTKGRLMVDANTSVDFHTQVPADGKIVFDMGSDNIQDSTVATGDFCAVKTGTKTVEAGERIDTIQVYEGKTYDARDLDWFVFKERQQLLDRNGNTVAESDKGVSLPDLQTMADETNLKVDFKAGTIAFTNTIVWFKIENGLPKDPYILANGLRSSVTTTGTLPGTVPAGTQMGFLLVGATAPHNPLAENPNAKLRFSGTKLQYSTNNGSSWSDIPETKIVYSIKEWNRYKKESVVAGISDHPTKAGEKVLTIVFEDIVSGGDRDFEDVHCTVYMQGVTKLKTKVVKETKEVDVYTEIPCGNCSVTIQGTEPLTCDNIEITKNGNDVKINNKNALDAYVYYTVYENNVATKTGDLLISPNTVIDFDTPVPSNGKIVFAMGAESIPDSTIVTGDYCAIKTGTKIIEVGERVEIIQVYEGKVYDARDLDWFIFKERQKLQDREGNLVPYSDKGVSLLDLTTMADETNLKFDFKAGRIGYTDAIIWFKIEGGLPTEPHILSAGLTNMSTATATLPGTVPAGTKMGFVLVGDVAAKNPIVQNPTAQLRFSGTRLQYSTDNGATWNTIPEHQLVYSIKDWNRNQHEGVVAGISDHPTKAGDKVLTVVFEDIAGGYGDLDYEDVHCTVYMQGVTKLKTKVVKITKEVDVYTEIPCGTCEVTVESGDNSTCPDDAYRYKLSNGSPDGENYHVWMPNLFVQGQTTRMTFEKEAYMDIKRDGSSARLYGYATVTGSGGSSMGARYLVDATFHKATNNMQPKITLPTQTPDVVKDWKYFEMDASKSTISLVGGNQVFKLTHMPANKQFGLQVGVSASGQNVKFGAAAWFFWEEVGTDRKGSGDFIMDMENLCPDDTLDCPDNAFRHRLSNAVSDDAHNGNHDHSIWMPNLFVSGQDAKFTFDNNAYMDILKDDSKAHIYGYATVTNGGGTSQGARYLVDVWFNLATNPMTAKKELKPGYQPDEVTNKWKFFEMDETKATMTKVGGSQVIKLTHKPANRKMGLQVGFTANGKNVKFGASAWFFWEIVGEGKSGHGDFNLDLENLCPGQPLPDLCEPPIEVIYVLDMSGSMKWEYPKTDDAGKTISRFRAAQDALIYANSALAQQGMSSRSALIVFNDTTAQVMSGFTNNFQQLNSIVENLGAPNGGTPMSKGMLSAKELLKTRSADKKPVVVLITDGVPTYDLRNFPYDHLKVSAVDIFDPVAQVFRIKEVVAKMGGLNTWISSSYGLYNGQVLSEVMGAIDEIKAETPDALIYGLGIDQDAGNNEASFNDDILEYGAHKTGATYHTVDNAESMIKAMANILLDATCNPHNPSEDPACELLLNGTPLNDSTQLNTVWNGQDDKVTVTIANITEPVNYTWKLTFPTDPSVQAVEVSGTFTQDGTYEITIPIPPKGQWGNVATDGSGLFKANISFNISTPCGDQNWERIYYATDEADVQVVKTVDKATANVGDTLTYTITVTNNGPRKANSVTLTDALPDGLSILSVTGGSFEEDTMDLGSINLGESKTIKVTAIATATGTITNTATVSVGSPVDPDTSNNTSSVQTVVVAKPKADLAITGTGPATIGEGKEATYIFTVTNNGPDKADNISIANAIPTGATLISSTHTTITSLDLGASATFEVKLLMNNLGTYQLTSSVSSTVEDPNLANNTAAVTTEVTFDTSDEKCYASGVLNHTPGTNLDGSPVLPELGDKSKVTNKPERTNAIGTYTSLGFGGDITMTFAMPIKNGTGNDLRIVEASPAGTTCASNPEKADVFASQDGQKWVYLGRACGANSDFDLGELNWAVYVRVIDVSNPTHFTDATANGFDVDGMACLHGMPDTFDPAPLVSCVAAKLVSFKPGQNQDGTDLDDGNDPNKALGDVTNPDDANEAVSLGFGGELIVKFDYVIFNGDNDDLEIIEHSPISDCSTNPEKAKVYASQDGNNWVLLGEACLDAKFDFGSLKWAQYFKIVDVSNTADFSDANANGFDVDAIRCAGGSVYQAYQGDKVASEDNVTILPNPVRTDLGVDVSKLYSVPASQVINVKIELTDIDGKKLASKTVGKDAFDSKTLHFDMTNKASGLYLVKCIITYKGVNGDTQTAIIDKKVIKN
ncbi:lectin-like domain-containing protein [Microscilla marina]|nr:DUF4114 domain-containing protein [Microscilla marina]